jgi:transposase
MVAIPAGVRIPAQHCVVVIHRPKYGCRGCERVVVQAPAPEHLIKNGIPSEAMVATVVVDKLPGISRFIGRPNTWLCRALRSIDRSTLADWVGTAAAELTPVY